MIHSHLDFVAHGFGFMLHIGFIVFLPYIYTYTTRFLYLYPGQASQSKYVLALAAVLEGKN